MKTLQILNYERCKCSSALNEQIVNYDCEKHTIVNWENVQLSFTPFLRTRSKIDVAINCINHYQFAKSLVYSQ